MSPQTDLETLTLVEEKQEYIDFMRNFEKDKGLQHTLFAFR